jgi:hypothetical protein
MKKNSNQSVRLARSRPAAVPLTLEYVLTEVVRILHEERADARSLPAHQLAA